MRSESNSLICSTITFDMSLLIIFHSEISQRWEKEEGVVTFGISAIKIDLIDPKMKPLIWDSYTISNDYVFMCSNKYKNISIVHPSWPGHFSPEKYSKINWISSIVASLFSATFASLWNIKGYSPIPKRMSSMWVSSITLNRFSKCCTAYRWISTYV